MHMRQRGCTFVHIVAVTVVVDVVVAVVVVAVVVVVGHGCCWSWLLLEVTPRFSLLVECFWR